MYFKHKKFQFAMNFNGFDVLSKNMYHCIKHGSCVPYNRYENIAQVIIDID